MLNDPDILSDHTPKTTSTLSSMSSYQFNEKMKAASKQQHNNGNHSTISETTNGNGLLLTAAVTLSPTINDIPQQQQQQTSTSSTISPITVNGITYTKNVKVLKSNNQIRELQTVLRDRYNSTLLRSQRPFTFFLKRETSHSEFKFYADRLIRLLVEEGLNELPYSKCTVVTSTGCEYNGVKYIKGVCGVSIMRSGEAMEKGLRECCRSIRIGKILIQAADEDKNKSSVIYSKFPEDIVTRKVLLMYPITTSGTTINLAINVLKDHGVDEDNILLLCLFATPTGLQSVNNHYPGVHILVSEIHPQVPTDFGQRYFGTE